MDSRASISVESAIRAPVERVWTLWTEPEHIVNWCNASDDWHAPEAENELRAGGRFRTAMAARDGSASFDFTGTYTRIIERRLIEYTIDDGRKVEVRFTPVGGSTSVVETFEPESTHSREVQQGGWQAILDNFTRYVEADR